LKVDLATDLGEGVPDPCTFKGSEPGFGDWVAFTAWADAEAHDDRCIEDIGGSGLNVSIGMSVGDSQSRFITTTDPSHGKWCNSWVQAKNYDGPPGADFHLILSGEALTPGTYRVYGYHNSIGGSEANMPYVSASASCPGNTLTGCCHCEDATGDDCEGVTEEANDVDIPITHVTVDDLELISISMVQFHTDGSPVMITYRAGDQSSSIFSAFILEVVTPQVISYDPTPLGNAEDICPDAVLTWQPGAYAAENDIYLGTDFNDVNDADTSSSLYITTQEANSYDPCGLLDFGATYYWRVDAVNDVCAPYVWKGRTWNFTVSEAKAYDPHPVDGQWSVSQYDYLGWQASCLANAHDVYLGTDFDDVNDATTADLNVYRGQQTTLGWFMPYPGFDPYTRYYWRIDEVGDDGVIKGDVWTFMTQGGTLFHYTFDGPFEELVHDRNPSDVNIVTDDMESVTYAIVGDKSLLTYARSNPLFNTGGTSADFGSNPGEVGLYRGWGPLGRPKVRGTDVTDLTASEYTIEMWIRPDTIDNDMGLFAKWDLSYVLELNDDGRVNFSQAGSDDIVSDANNPLEAGNWYHVAAVFDSGDLAAPQKLYIDSLLSASGGTAATNPSGDDDPATIGIRVNPPRDHDKGYETTDEAFDGMIDELRVTDLALGPPDFIHRGDLGIAWLPRPFDYETDVEQNIKLGWKPGDFADSHEVYFGTSWADVNSAGTLSAAFRGKQDPCEYDPPEVLELETTYYWRVDEVNDSNGYVWKGSVWRFTTTDFRTVDNMESYNAVPGSGNEIMDTWDDGFVNWTGSQISLEYVLGPTIHDGRQSMKFEYQLADFLGGYAEVDANTTGPIPGNLEIGTDWTTDDVKALTLYFRGVTTNTTGGQSLYVAISDSGTTDVVKYTDYGGEVNDITVEDWHEWIVPLADFGVTLTDVQKVRFGLGDRDNPAVGLADTGTIFFDDIRLTLPGCVPSQRSPEFAAIDMSGNCVIDFADVEIMASGWLVTDVNLGVVDPPASGPVLRYQFDETSGTTLADSANGYTGTFFTDVDQTPSEIAARMDPGLSGNSFHFASEIGYGGIMMPATVFTDNGISQEITVAVWIKNAHPDEEPDGTAYMWEFREWNGVSPDANERVLAVEVTGSGDEYTFHDSSQSTSYDHEWDDHLDWQHYAFIRDANNLRIYVNGALEAIDDSNTAAMATPGLLYIGISADLAPGNTDDLHDGFTGNMDIWEIYNYALSDSEAGYLGTNGTGIVPITSPANFYDHPTKEPEGSRAVNFRDFDFIANEWLTEEKWPSE
jgi:hypothetical protein